MNRFDEMREAVADAKQTMRAAENVANDMAGMLVGNLHHVSGYRLAALKKELREFDSRDHKWVMSQ